MINHFHNSLTNSESENLFGSAEKLTLSLSRSGILNSVGVNNRTLKVAVCKTPITKTIYCYAPRRDALRPDGSLRVSCRLLHYKNVFTLKVWSVITSYKFSADQTLVLSSNILALLIVYSFINSFVYICFQRLFGYQVFGVIFLLVRKFLRRVIAFIC